MNIVAGGRAKPVKGTWKNRRMKKRIRRADEARKATPSFWVPAEFKDRLVRLLLSDPGRFAGSPREFAWRELKRAAEARRGRAG